MTESLLSVRDLRVGFVTEGGRLQAVDGVSFDLATGEVLAIVGESGSGKSVTAQTILGLTRSPNARIEGSVRLRGKELIDASEAELCDVRGERVAMVFQDPMTSFNPSTGSAIRSSRRSKPIERRQARGTRVSMRSSCSTPSASPTPRCGSTTIRTNSPAGCGSGR